MVSTILPKNERKKFDFTTLVPQVDLFSFVFLEEWKTPKKHFEFNWPLDPTTNSETTNPDFLRISLWIRLFLIKKYITNNTWKTWSHCKEGTEYLMLSKFVKIRIKSLKTGSWIWWTRHLFWITMLSQDVFLKAICFNVHGSEWIEGKKF